MTSSKKKTPLAGGVISTETNSKIRKSSVNNTLASRTDQRELTEWAKQFQQLQKTLGTPITQKHDPRYKTLVESAGDYATSGPAFPLSFIEELAEEDPAGLGELYFLKYAEKPIPPVPAPSWATLREMFWGFPQEVEILFTSKVFDTGDIRVGWQQIVSIQMFDDQTRERLHQPVLHESEVEFFIRDTSSNLLLAGGPDKVAMLGAAVEDSVRDFTDATSKELHRHTEPGSPRFEEAL